MDAKTGHLLLYAMVAAVPMASGANWTTVTLPPVERTVDELRQTLAQVEEQMNRLSDEALTGLIQSRVGEDLNWIRLNGTFVGGLIGVAPYLLYETLGFRPRLICTGPIDTVVPARVRPQILATVRESLSNIVRHAQASDVTVEVSVEDDEVVTRTSDDGVGIGAQTRRSGLRNLTERAQALGGTIEIRENQPHGTIVELRAPLTGD